MEMQYRQEASDSYLVLEEKESDVSEEFHLRMMTENTIKGLLHAGRRCFNSESQIYYRISGRQSLKEVLETKEMDFEMLRDLLREINQVLCSLNEYLLDADCLLLSPEFVYLSSEGVDIAFCLYPYARKDIRQQIRSLCESFLDHVKRDDDRAVSMVYRLYRMTREKNFRYGQIVEELLLKQAQKEQTEMSDETIQGKMTYRTEADKVEKEKEESKEPSEMPGTILMEVSEGQQKGFLTLLICLTMGSMLSFFFVYYYMSYQYGYSMLRVLGMKEGMISFTLFLVITAITALTVVIKKKLWRFGR